MDSVRGTVNYLAAGSRRNRLYVAPGDQRATARYEPCQVRIGGGRPHRGDLTLDAAGFTLVDHQTSVPVPSLDNPAALDGAYTAEARALVGALTGADYVVSLGWMLRRTPRSGTLPRRAPARASRSNCAPSATSADPKPGERAVAAGWFGATPPTSCCYHLDGPWSRNFLGFRPPGPGASPPRRY